jgi:hypothetical protein
VAIARTRQAAALHMILRFERLRVVAPSPW